MKSWFVALQQHSPAWTGTLRRGTLFQDRYLAVKNSFCCLDIVVGSTYSKQCSLLRIPSGNQKKKKNKKKKKKKRKHMGKRGRRKLLKQQRISDSTEEADPKSGAGSSSAGGRWCCCSWTLVTAYLSALSSIIFLVYNADQISFERLEQATNRSMDFSFNLLDRLSPDSIETDFVTSYPIPNTKVLLFPI